MQTMKINLREIQLSKSRPTLPEVVNSLAASMEQVGLLQPIIVKKSPIFDGVLMVHGYKVVVGNHRVSAARSLGWADIDAVLHDGDELHAELSEIDENLQRAELSPAQRAASIQRRKEIWEAMHPNSDRNPVENRGRGRPTDFSGDTQRATGEDRRRTNEHLARAEALGPDLHAVIGTSLDKGVELDALKDMEPDERKELIQRAQAGEQVSARAANDDPARLKRLVAQTIGEIARLAKAGTPEDVAEIMATQAINPDLKPYIEAIYNAYRARRQVA